MSTPLDAILFKALDKRVTHTVGALVWVREPVTRVIKQYEVIAVCMLMTNVVQFHLHYCIAPPKTQPTLRGAGRRLVAWHHVYQSFEDAASAGEFFPPDEDPVDADINTAVQYHRNLLQSRIRGLG